MVNYAQPWGVAKRQGSGLWIRYSQVRILPPQHTRAPYTGVFCSPLTAARNSSGLGV